MHKRKVQAFPPLLLSSKRGERNREIRLFEVVIFTGKQSLKYRVKPIQRRTLTDVNIFPLYLFVLFQCRVCFSANFVSRNMVFD
jgi:hypothetical protein